MSLVYKQVDSVETQALVELYSSVGWTNYTKAPDVLTAGVAASHWVLTAWEQTADSEHLVGLIRIVGDGKTIAYIQDILVDPSYQRRGIGTELMRRALEESEGIRQVVLMTDDTPKTRAFYYSHGFKTGEEYKGLAFAKYDFG